jgi:hypothetical protein
VIWMVVFVFMFDKNDHIGQNKIWLIDVWRWINSDMLFNLTGDLGIVFVLLLPCIPLIFRLLFLVFRKWKEAWVSWDPVDITKSDYNRSITLLTLCWYWLFVFVWILLLSFFPPVTILEPHQSLMCLDSDLTLPGVLCLELLVHTMATQHGNNSETKMTTISSQTCNWNLERSQFRCQTQNRKDHLIIPSENQLCFWDFEAWCACTVVYEVSTQAK